MMPSPRVETFGAEEGTMKVSKGETQPIVLTSILPMNHMNDEHGTITLKVQ